MVVKIGLDRFDELIEKSGKGKSAILLLGPPKCGKSLFGMHYLHHGLNNGEYGIYIVTNSFPEDVVKRFESIGNIDRHLQEGKLKFLDCYTIHAGVHKEDTVFILRMNGPGALTEIGIAISQIMKEMGKKEKARVVFDSLSTIMLFSNPKTVANFVQSMTRKIKNAGSSSVFVLEEGMHDEKDVITINSLLDSLVHFKKEGGEKKIDVAGMGFDATVNYSIVDGKLIIS